MATLLFDGKPIMEVEPVEAKFEVGPELVWQYNGANVEIKVDGEKVKPWVAGQTGTIEMINGELIEFVAVEKEAHQ